VTEGLSQKLFDELKGSIRGEVYTDKIHRAAFSSDASIYRIFPCCVVVPQNREDVAATVKFAAANGIPIAARGAGSGVAGESLTTGIVLDFGVYMKRICGVDDSAQKVRCQPGVVLDELNAYLADYGRTIGPDPSSGNRAMVGGCVANNATGPHSLAYGYMADYVEEVEAVTADGSIVRVGNDVDPAEVENETVKKLVNGCRDILKGRDELIDSALPSALRNRSGYNIAGVCHEGKVDLARLLAGSEGTLAVFTEVTLRTVDIPVYAGLVQLEFDSMDKMARAVPVIVESGAAGCELMDDRLVRMATEAYPRYRDVLNPKAKVTLFVEHMSSDRAELEEKIETTEKAVGDLAATAKIVVDEDSRNRISKARKDAVPLLYRAKGRKQPIPFVEDTAVDNSKLAEYVAELEKIGQKYGFVMSYYGHAGDGELHLRPYLDLTDAEDVRKMREIAEEVFSLAWSLGGSISGEHGDGIVRSGFIRAQYGDEYYQLLRRIKQLFDPRGVLNPGKIIDCSPDEMVKNLRAGWAIKPSRLKSGLFFEDGELRRELDQCNGCGLCLSKADDLRMCPVFRALGEELGSSRAKANLLRLWAGGEFDDSEFESDEFGQILSLCINCKACSLQCPSGVDISKLVTAARSEYAKRRGLKLVEKMLAKNRYLGRVGGLFSPLSGLVMNMGVFKFALDKLVGLDRRRDLPRFERGSFIAAGRKYLRKAPPINQPVDKVAYFVDTYVNYNDHSLGFDVLEILRHNKVDVILPKQLPAPLPAIIYGDVKTAKADLNYSVGHLARAVRDGYKIVCSEPSAAMCLKQELRHFVKGADARLVSKNCYELTGYLRMLWRQGRLKTAKAKVKQQYVYHLPCHLLAIDNDGGGGELLRQAFGISIEDLNAGCCGMAGTFGMQKKNYDLSMGIGDNLKKALKTHIDSEIVTECSACAMQIEHISGRAVSHPASVIARIYGLREV